MNTKHPRPRKPAKLKSSKKGEGSVRPGPKAEVLTIEGDWQDAIKKSFQKKKPSVGWPK